ncbi:hypothetical protein JTB14_031044 [Gonioctena quinquepunctata]|nr:hypothetical protein JTB14_031044 [Gonioctena quinquepunctata]
MKYFKTSPPAPKTIRESETSLSPGSSSPVRVPLLKHSRLHKDKEIEGKIKNTSKYDEDSESSGKGPKDHYMKKRGNKIEKGSRKEELDDGKKGEIRSKNVDRDGKEDEKYKPSVGNRRLFTKNVGVRTDRPKITFGSCGRKICNCCKFYSQCIEKSIPDEKTDPEKSIKKNFGAKKMSAHSSKKSPSPVSTSPGPSFRETGAGKNDSNRRSGTFKGVFQLEYPNVTI